MSACFCRLPHLSYNPAVYLYAFFHPTKVVKGRIQSKFIFHPLLSIGERFVYERVNFDEGGFFVALLLEDFGGIDFDPVNGFRQLDAFVGNFKIKITVLAFLPTH